MRYRITIEQNNDVLFENTFDVANDSSREQLVVQVEELTNCTCDTYEVPMGIVDVYASDSAVSVYTANNQMVDPLITLERIPGWEPMLESALWRQVSHKKKPVPAFGEAG